MIDLILLGLYAVILGFTHSKDGLLMLASFSLSVAYTHSLYFEAHPAWANHLIVSIIFMPAILLCAKWVSIASIFYAFFQWVTSGEYLFFDETEIFISIFKEATTVLNLLIMAALIYERYNYNYHKDSLLADSWVINLCIRHLQISSKSKESEQC